MCNNDNHNNNNNSKTRSGWHSRLLSDCGLASHKPLTLKRVRLQDTVNMASERTRSGIPSPGTIIFIIILLGHYQTKLVLAPVLGTPLTVNEDRRGRRQSTECRTTTIMPHVKGSAAGCGLSVCCGSCQPPPFTKDHLLKALFLSCAFNVVPLPKVRSLRVKWSSKYPHSNRVALSRAFATEYSNNIEYWYPTSTANQFT